MLENDPARAILASDIKLTDETIPLAPDPVLNDKSSEPLGFNRAAKLRLVLSYVVKAPPITILLSACKAIDRIQPLAPAPGSNVVSRLPETNSSSSMVIVMFVVPAIVAPPPGLEIDMAKLSLGSTRSSS